jgi:stress-induced morphogen
MAVSVTICANCSRDPSPQNTVANLFRTVPSADELRERIEQAMPGADVEVKDLTGGGDHFRAEIVSERFQGLSRIDQHKLVYDVFGPEIGGPIHALSLKTSTPGGPQ